MKHPLTIRLSPETRDALGRLAQREGRSMAGYLEYLIRREAVEAGAWASRRLTAVPPRK